MASVIAFGLEGNEEWGLLAWLLVQRFFYCQFMYDVGFKSVVATIKGGTVDWEKLERNASVKV